MSLQTTSPKDLVGMCTIYFAIHNTECCKFHGCSIRDIIIKEWTPFVPQDDRSKAEFGKEFRPKGVPNSFSVRNCDALRPLVLSLRSKFLCTVFPIQTSA
jgi:hypothetical protein